MLHRLVIAICAVIWGADTWVELEASGKAKEEGLKQCLALPHEIPSHDTFARVLARLDPEQRQRGFLCWIEAVSEVTQGEGVAIDGKTLRRSFDRAAGKGAIPMVSAWATATWLVLGQRKVEEKSNEVTAIPALLRLLVLEGGMVTIDALGCQKEIARTSVEQGADYVLALKGNQGVLHDEVELFFTAARQRGFRDLPHGFSRTVDGEHGRIEVRRYRLVSEIAWLAETAAWPGLHSIGMVEAER
jgi:predicted transposase YbfD/YdcC